MSDGNTSPTEPSGRPRRTSFTSSTMQSIFGRSNSVSQSAATPPFHGPITIAAAEDQRRRRMSSVGLAGTSPTQPSSFASSLGRRASVSTAGSESLDENAIDDDDAFSPHSPNTPFGRRMSFSTQALRNARGGPSSATTGRNPPIALFNAATRSRALSTTQASMTSKPRTASDYSSARSGEGFNWPEQLRSRAESAVSRPSFSTSPNHHAPKAASTHERSRSIAEMPAPPTATIPPVRERPKPDAFQERILKGDFYMD